MTHKKPDAHGATTAAKGADVELEGVPEEEDISKADAEERLDKDPEEQRNYTDPARRDDAAPER